MEIEFLLSSQMEEEFSRPSPPLCMVTRTLIKTHQPLAGLFPRDNQWQNWVHTLKIQPSSTHLQGEDKLLPFPLRLGHASATFTPFTLASSPTKASISYRALLLFISKKNRRAGLRFTRGLQLSTKEALRDAVSVCLCLSHQNS